MAPPSSARRFRLNRRGPSGNRHARPVRIDEVDPERETRRDPGRIVDRAAGDEQAGGVKPVDDLPGQPFDRHVDRP